MYYTHTSSSAPIHAFVLADQDAPPSHFGLLQPRSQKNGNCSSSHWHDMSGVVLHVAVFRNNLSTALYRSSPSGRPNRVRLTGPRSETSLALTPGPILLQRQIEPIILFMPLLSSSSRQIYIHRLSTPSPLLRTISPAATPAMRPPIWPAESVPDPGRKTAE